MVHGNNNKWPPRPAPPIIEYDFVGLLLAAGIIPAGMAAGFGWSPF
jgi:hypothetical protein